jgi:hypothetical protein
MSTDKKPVVTLVGHCGPDSSFLRMAISSAAPGATITMADTHRELADAVDAKPDLMMFNRVLESGFDDSDGVSLMKQTHAEHDVKVMMISNFEKTQADAEAAGAVPGFGKGDIGSDKAKQRIRDALGLA